MIFPTYSTFDTLHIEKFIENGDKSSNHYYYLYGHFWTQKYKNIHSALVSWYGDITKVSLICHKYAGWTHNEQYLMNIPKKAGIYLEIVL